MSITLDGSNVSTVGVLNQGTAQNTTSGTSIDFTGIPAGVKRIVVMFAGVSTNGTSIVQILLGTGSTSYATTGYSATGTSQTTSLAVTTSTTGFITAFDSGASYVRNQTIVLTLVSGNQWLCNGSGSDPSASRVFTNAGTVTLGATLTAVRITTVNGTDTFDAGSVNIQYE